MFEALVRPALRRLQGYAQLDRPHVPVHVASEVVSKAGRTDFVRCELEWRLGVLWAAPAGEQVSGHLLPQSRAHAFREGADVKDQLCRFGTVDRL